MKYKMGKNNNEGKIYIKTSHWVNTWLSKSIPEFQYFAPEKMFLGSCLLFTYKMVAVGWIMSAYFSIFKSY